MLPLNFHNPLRVITKVTPESKYFYRSIIFGPVEYGGLGLPNLYTLQGIVKINLFLGHTRLQGKSGKLLLIIVSQMQLHSGYGTLFLNLSFPTYGTWLDHTWWTWLWEFSSLFQCHYYTSKLFWHPLIQHENDSHLMEYFLTLTKDTKILNLLNRCRIQLQVILLSDITSSDGWHILPEVKLGKMYNRISALKWPFQPHPSKSDWKIWCSYINRLETGGRLTKPLGKWVLISHQNWPIYYNQSTKTFYEKSGNLWYAMPSLQNHRNTHTIKFNANPAKEVNPLTSALLPATVTYSRSPIFTIQYGPTLYTQKKDHMTTIFQNVLVQHIIGPYPPTITELHNISYGLSISDIIIASDGSYYPDSGNAGHSW